MYEIVIIGAGIIGSAIARELSKFNLKVLLLEKNNDVACETTKANSAIVHAGYDAKLGTNMSKFNILGNNMYDQICKELDVPFKRIGSLVIAFDKSDEKKLEKLFENGKKLKIPGLEMLGIDEIRKMEPNLNKNIISALYAPTAGIVEPWELAIAYAENAIDNGVELKLNEEVINIEKQDDNYIVFTKKNKFKTQLIINCAGLYADEIYKMVVNRPEFEIKPRRGQYYLLDKEAKGLVNSIIFQCPNERGKGVLISPTAHGNIIIGPNSEDLDIDNKECTNTTSGGLDFVKKRAVKTCPNIPFNKNITNFAGLRAEPSTGDFIIEESKQSSGFINCAGIKSPGLASSPAIACYIADLIEKILEYPAMKENYNPIRRPRIKFKELNSKEKIEIIKKDSRYGQIICRCEMISEGEIVDAIHRSAGARSVNGIKRRVRPGSGRCQGGFCGPSIVKILARELRKNPIEILQENKGSSILVGKTKND